MSERLPRPDPDPRLEESLDPFEAALAFAIREALRLDEQRAATERSTTLRVVEPERRGGQAA